MILLTIMFLSIIFFSLILLLINFFFSKKSLLSREKPSPFECGFDPLINPRLPFSIHFFMISLMFLIFDVEITLLIPSITLLFYFNKFLILSMIFFLCILLLGLYIEYADHSIDWNI